MAQGVLSFKYEEEKRETGMTGLAGLPVYLDLASVMGISASIACHIHVKHQGRNLSMEMRHLRQQFSVAPVRYLVTPVC